MNIVKKLCGASSGGEEQRDKKTSTKDLIANTTTLAGAGATVAGVTAVATAAASSGAAIGIGAGIGGSIGTVIGGVLGAGAGIATGGGAIAATIPFAAGVGGLGSTIGGAIGSLFATATAPVWAVPAAVVGGSAAAAGLGWKIYRRISEKKEAQSDKKA